MIKTLFNEQSDNPVGVEDKIGSLRIFVSYHTAESMRLVSCFLGKGVGGSNPRRTSRELLAGGFVTEYAMQSQQLLQQVHSLIHLPHYRRIPWLRL